MEDNWSELSRAQWELLKRPITLFHSKLQRDNSANVHINKCEGKSLHSISNTDPKWIFMGCCGIKMPLYQFSDYVSSFSFPVPPEARMEWTNNKCATCINVRKKSFVVEDIKCLAFTFVKHKWAINVVND